MKRSKTRRGFRPFVASQRGEVLRLLREAGPRGVSREEMIFRYHGTQCGTRIFELQKMGYVIRSEDRGGRYPTWYVLESAPLQAESLNPKRDWYERQTGGPRPREADDLPLFASRDPR